MRDRHVPETSTLQHTTLTTDKHPSPAGFKTTISSSERPHAHALDRAATGICHRFCFSLGY